MNGQNCLIKIVLKKNKKLYLPFDDENALESIINYEIGKIKIVNIVSHCGIKICENKIIRINDENYKEKKVTDLNDNEAKNLILLLNEKAKKICSLSNYKEIKLLSECISHDIDELILLIEKKEYKVFENKTLEEIAVEECNMNSNEVYISKYKMNILGYFEISNIVIKFDKKYLEKEYLYKQMLNNFVDYLYYNTTLEIIDKEHIKVKIINKTQIFKYDIKKMFDEYVWTDSDNLTEEDIKEEFEKEYIEKYQYNDYDLYQHKVADFIIYRSDIQKNMLDRVEYFFNNEEWFDIIEDYLDGTMSIEEIQEDFEISMQGIIDNFIISEFVVFLDTWERFWNRMLW